MLPNNTKIITRQWIKEVWNRGNVSLIDEMHSERYVHHDLYSLEAGEKNIKYMKELVTNLRRAYAEFQVSVDDLIAEENRVAVRWKARGILNREFFKISPQNKEISWYGMAFLNIERERISDTWILTNHNGFMSRRGK